MIRCSCREGMFADDPPEYFYDGPLVRVRGRMARICHHEAGHALLKYALGVKQGPLSVNTDYRRGPGGVVIASHSGLCDGWHAPGGIRRPVAPKESILIRIDELNFFACWKLFLRPAMINLPGTPANGNFAGPMACRSRRTQAPIATMPSARRGGRGLAVVETAMRC